MCTLVLLREARTSAWARVPIASLRGREAPSICTNGVALLRHRGRPSLVRLSIAPSDSSPTSVCERSATFFP